MRREIEMSGLRWHQRKNWFSMLELMIVIVVIMILTTISAFIYASIMRGVLIKSQVVAFSSMSSEMQVYGSQKATNQIARNKKITLMKLRKTGSLDQKREFITADPKAEIQSVFDTTIQVWVSKVSSRSTNTEINANYGQIKDHETLTGEFEFYYGKNHEKDGGESGDTFGLSSSVAGDSFVYHYKFIYKDRDDTETFEYKFSLH